MELFVNDMPAGIGFQRIGISNERQIELVILMDDAWSSLGEIFDDIDLFKLFAAFCNNIEELVHCVFVHTESTTKEIYQSLILNSGKEN